MIVRTSNLNLRFYVDDGWTREILNSCMKVGVVEMPFPFDEKPYFVIPIGNQVSIGKLADIVTAVAHWNNKLPLIIGDKEIIEELGEYT